MMNSPMSFSNHPGATSNYELTIIEILAAQILENANFLEIGSMFGRTSRVWYYNKPSNASMTVADNFNFEYDTFANFRGDPTLAEHAYNKSKNDKTLYYTFLELCNDFVDYITVVKCPNVIDWDVKTNYDFVYTDAGHDNNMVLAQINKFITSGNIISGHNYSDEHPNVIDNCKQAAKIYKRKLIVIDNTTIWMLIEENSYIIKKLKNKNVSFTEIQ